MPLRRISENFKSQNWTAVCLDLVIVVLGIFLGLQVSQWYEHRQEIELGYSILERLQGEFEEISAEAHAAFRFHQEEALALEVVRKSVHDGKLDMDKKATFLAGLRDAITYDMGPSRSGTYVEILSSGQFRLLRDPELRSALSTYDDNLQKGDSFFAIQHHNQRKHDLVWNRHFVHRPSETVDFRGSPTGIMVSRGEIAKYDLDAMTGDQEFRNAIDRLIEYHIYFQYWHGTIQRSADRVLTLIESGET